MKSGLRGIQVFVTAFVLIVMSICIIGTKEYYPFAPYTMYSYSHNLADQHFLRFVCLNEGHQSPVTEEMIRPLDEARLGTSINDIYYSGGDKSLIIAKLTALRDIVKRNSFSCGKVVLRFLKFPDAQAYFNDRGIVIATYEGEGSP